MPDLKLPGAKNARNQQQQHRKAIRGAVPLDFKREKSSETQNFARRPHFSAAC